MHIYIIVKCSNSSFRIIGFRVFGHDICSRFYIFLIKVNQKPKQLLRYNRTVTMVVYIICLS